MVWHICWSTSASHSSCSVKLVFKLDPFPPDIVFSELSPVRAVPYSLLHSECSDARVQ